MSDPIDPIRPLPVERRARERRQGDRRQAAAEPAPSTLPVPVSGPAAAPESQAGDGAAAFAAQLLGQSGRKRGLRAGPQALEEARAAYLEAEYSGPADRRASAGQVRKTDV